MVTIAAPLPFNPPSILSKPTEAMGSTAMAPENEYDKVAGLNLGIGQLFHDQVRKSPEAIAVLGDGITITYGNLHIQASFLAQRLSQCIVGNDEPVGVIVQHGVADIVTQMAIIYAGSSCVPIDPTFPDHLIRTRLVGLDVRCVLVDQANRHRNLPFQIISIDEYSAVELPAAESAYPVASSLEHCTHLILTSGTTDEPKAVRITARSILHVAYHAPFEPLHRSDVVAHVNNSSFDVSLFDVWGPLLRGARIAVLGKTVMLDPPRVATEIERLGITVMATSTALLNLAAFTFPKAFAKLRVYIIGGEVANITAINIILNEGPPQMLINAYGPTECCVWCLAQQVTIKDVEHGSVSIGLPVGRTVAYIANEEGELSDEGELWIGGPGVSPGYANQPDKNATAFTELAGLVNGSGNPLRLYRTGDMVRRRPDGRINYVGRRDHQVKIRGFRVELEAVESALLETGLFSEAAAMKIELPQRGAGSILVAFAVAADVSHPPNSHEAAKAVSRVLPHYMIPQLEFISHMPLNSHAKVDRKKLQKLFSHRWNKANQSEQPQGVRSTLAGLWENILASSVAGYKDEDDFFSVGGTSLQASLLISHIRRTFNIQISLLTLYDNCTMGSLASVITERLDGGLETLRDERDIWLADSHLADDLSCPLGKAVDWRRDTEGRVFVTGATGFVGAFLLADLLQMPGVFQVGCLVRACDATAGLDRIRDALAKYNLLEECFAHKLLPIPGYLECDHLGMEPERFEELANWASVVFHLGARVNYTQPYSLHRPANTLGTRNVVQFSFAGRLKSIHYVSSISCFGPTGVVTGATTVREDEPLLPHVVALKYDHGYAQSQWVAEQLLRRLIDRGFPIAIYRPGFITGHSQTGVCNPEDFLGRLIQACCEMGCFPHLPNQRKEFVPVDYTCAAILHIAASPTSLRRAYHIVPPTRAASIDLDDSMGLVSLATGSPLHKVSYAEWTDRLAAVSPQSLIPLQPMLAEKVWGGQSRWELYENMPMYETTNTVKALADYPGRLEFPVLGISLMKKYLVFLMKDHGKGDNMYSRSNSE